MSDRAPRLAFAGDREIAVRTLGLLLERGDRPVALLLTDEGRASHDRAIIERCGSAGIALPMIRGRDVNAETTVRQLADLDLDYIVCVHFPYLLRRPILKVAKSGVLNLHPSYLPYNRGWHTPTWAILDGTPAGASFHYMTESLDSGEVVYQRQIDVDPGDTAHTLYQRLLALEVDVFKEGWERIRGGRVQPRRQPEHAATAHRRQSLFDPAVQQIDLSSVEPAGHLLRRLRALTTSRLDEAAYFVEGDRKYRVQVTITPEPGSAPHDSAIQEAK